ncbi:MAG: chromate transporter [Treponema sp.]|jgi:chromate transporter|nr:chromate transporter [Treponema sp.]
MKEYLEIFLAFLEIGCLAFGGGYAVIPLVDRELIKKRGWVTMDEVMDYYTIAQITPGLIGVNLSTFVGYKQKGHLGGILATLGFVLPGVTLILGAAILISNFAEMVIVKHAFAGIRIAVGALILDTVLKLIKGVFKDIKGIIVYFSVFAISVLPKGVEPFTMIPAFVKSPVFLVLVSGLVGLIVYRQKPELRS